MKRTTSTTSRMTNAPSSTTETSTSTLRQLQLQRIGSEGCLKSKGGWRLLEKGATSGCAQFLVLGNQFQSVDVPGQCLDYFSNRGWGLWSCHGNHNQQLQHQDSKWCVRKECVEAFKPPATSTTTKSSTIATSTTSTSTRTSPGMIEGLSPEEAAVYNPNLSSYWDLGSCGRAGDNHHWSWCHVGLGVSWTLGCQLQVVVDPSLCDSQLAVLGFQKVFAAIDGCKFAYYQQYVCAPYGATPEPEPEPEPANNVAANQLRR